MGAPYGQYMLEDVLNGRLDAKMYVFLNTWQLSASERRKLLAATRGAVRVWCYAPGYFDGYKASMSAMGKLTGFKLRKVSLSKAWAEPTVVGKSLGLEQPFGVPKALAPLFAVTASATDDVLATYPDGSAAVAMRHTSNGTSLFVGVPALTSDLLRMAARKAGVHLFTETDCNVYANGPFLALHACQDGLVTINTAKVGPIRDVMGEQAIGRGPILSLEMTRGQTRVLRY